MHGQSNTASRLLSNRFYLRRGALAALMLCGSATVARADTASADLLLGGPLIPGTAQGTGEGAGTIDYFAHSYQAGLTQMGPNQTTGYSFTKSDNTNGTMVPAAAPANTKITVTSKTAETKYFPCVQILKQPKADNTQKTYYTSETLTSASGNFSSMAGLKTATVMFKGKNVFVGYTVAEAARANVATAPLDTGTAAGQAVDPLMVVPGTYDYAPQMDASIQLDSPTSSGGVTLFAADSTVFTGDDLSNFVADGSPYNESLWELSLNATGPVSGSVGLAIDFELNPIALQELSFPSSYLASLPGYSASLTPSQLAILIDQQIDASVASAVTVDMNGVASLSTYVLFPDGTGFSPSNSNGVEFADGVDAGIVAVPEPSMVGLVGVGMLGLAGRRRARKR